MDNGGVRAFECFSDCTIDSTTLHGDVGKELRRLQALLYGFFLHSILRGFPVALRISRSYVFYSLLVEFVPLMG